MDDPKATPFLTDIKELQRRAREHVEKGAVTPAYRGDVNTAVKLLNEALATEIVCTLRYRRHHYMAAGINYQAIADEFMEHARQEQEHADRIAERIRQLGGAPDFNPEGLLTRSHAQYAEGNSSSSTTGAIARQGAHQGAQKSIRTGVALCSTSRSNESSATG